jgi:hypothetical protein
MRRRDVMATVIFGLVLMQAGATQAQGSYTYRKLVCFGDAAPGGGTFAADFEAGELNSSGQFAFLAEPGGAEKIFLWDGTTARQIGGPSLKTPDGGVPTGNVYSPPSINDAGKVVLGQTVELDGERSEYILLYDAKTDMSTILAKKEMPAPGGGTFSYGGVAVPTRVFGDINNLDEVVFSNGVVPADGGDAHDAVFLSARGQSSVIAREGTTLPDGGRVLNAWWPRINEAGQVSFVANTAQNENYGVYLWDKGTITTIVKPDADVAGVKVAQAKWAVIGNGGDIVFVGEVGVADGGADIATQNTGVFLFSKGKLITVAKPGDPLPGGGTLRAIEHRRGPVQVNKDGAVVFVAEISDTEGGAFAYRNGKLEVIARTGATLEGVGQVGPMVKDVAGFSGYNIGLNDNGQVVFPATIDGTQCLILASPKP